MDIEELVKIGFNRNEAKVYLSLIKFGKSDANQIIKDTKFHKNIVYDNLEKLMNKGIVSYIIEGNKRIFQLTSSETLINIFEEKEKELEDKKKIAISISKEINKALKSVPNKQEAEIYRGVKGIKTFYNESLNGSDYVVFGAPQESIKIMDTIFWDNYNIKRIKQKIRVRMIFNTSIKSYGDSIKNKYTEVRYFDKNFEPLTETHIQDNKVAIIVWTEEPILFIIQSKSVADSYKIFFEDMWKIAKK
ncbi:MAG: helix-turn-helix domain-containing protein [Nanoarchaeota archaeon]